ncbi:MAG TPA: prepilin-type N-terminal cleavage/methylation domain-containing protein [Terriglobales bacterium]|nr:prepilin-type N-terminal cleavage/methylation domain-containing protein [Terriglobales bacterium]
MGDRLKTRESGFSLLEMMISVALGTVVLGAAVQIYSKGVGATWTVSQRAELQQDFRAASNMLTKDLSEAGAGLGNNVAIALPSGSTPRFGCDQTNTCYLNGVAGTYPLQSGTPYLYGLIPGYNLGPILNATQGATDTVTTIYTDNNFYLNCYAATVTSAGVVTFAPIVTTPVATAWPPPGCLPNSSVTSPQAVNDAVVGLTPGDLVLMNLNNSPIVGEVTGAVTATGTNTYTVPFAKASSTVDPLKMNQTPAGSGLNAAPVGATGANPQRLLVITYYIDNTVAPPRLMRQVSGHSPIPVAENVAYMKFSYDLFNDATSSPAVNCSNPGAATDGCNTAGASSGLLPNQITKINILNMAMNSTLMGAQYGTGTGYQRMDLQTSVSARNLTYANNYPN